MLKGFDILVLDVLQNLVLVLRSERIVFGTFDVELHNGPIVRKYSYEQLKASAERLREWRTQKQTGASFKFDLMNWKRWNEAGANPLESIVAVPEPVAGTNAQAVAQTQQEALQALQTAYDKLLQAHHEFERLYSNKPEPPTKASESLTDRPAEETNTYCTHLPSGHSTFRDLPKKV